MSSRRGFTLIELLVVIAIIGILSQVILSALNSARDKGADANIKSNLEGIRASATLKYDEMGNTYNKSGTDVDTDTCNGLTTANTILEQVNISSAIGDAVAKSGGGDATCKITDSAYAIAVPLKTDPAQFWCVDESSKGVALDHRPTGPVCD
jgi:prepilin-type N-terminal cleavage/methylation domain-containing protein